MKDFQRLSTEEQTDVIMQIGSKLTRQEIWYWEGLVHLLREQDKRINKAIEYIESYMPNYDFDKTNLIKLLEILKGSDKE